MSAAAVRGRLALAACVAAACVAAVCVAALGCATSAGGGDTGAPAPATGGAAASAPRAGGSAGVLYRPIAGTTYAFQRRDSLVLELPGAPQNQVFDRTAYLRVTVDPQGAASAGPYRVTIVLDSVQAMPGSAVPPDSIRAAAGTRWTGTLTPTGQLADLTGSDSTVVAEQVRGMLPLLFPHLPPEGAKSGETWPDSAERKVRVNAFSGLERAMLTYRASGPETQDGQRVLRLESEGTFTQTGSGAPFGQRMEMQATGTRHTVHHLGVDGALVAAQGGDQSDLTITVPDVGQSVPAHQVSSFSITAIGRPRSAR